MKLNWIAYYVQYNSYGIFSSNMVKALQTWGVDTLHLTEEDIYKPQWMLDQMRVSWDDLSIVCNEPRRITPVKGESWLFSMCEGETLSRYTIDRIHKSGRTRLVVPCQFCKNVFENSGLRIPISIVPLGVSPEDFPLIEQKPDRPFTFLTIADRGHRKGFIEVFDAFYRAFGGRTTGTRDVRLIIKSLPGWNSLSRMIVKHAGDLDPRIDWNISNYDRMADLYEQVDCVVLPSRSEGWGLPHREAAMMGLPVIVQKYAGVDDGHTEEWALTVEGGRMEAIPKAGRLGGSGNWMIADINELADRMRSVYDFPERASAFGLQARNWLMGHQTWMDSAAELINLIHDEKGSTYGSDLQHPSYGYDGTSSGRVLAYSSSVGQERSS